MSSKEKTQTAMSSKMTLTQAHALKTKNISVRQGEKTFYVKN